MVDRGAKAIGRAKCRNGRSPSAVPSPAMFRIGSALKLPAGGVVEERVPELDAIGGCRDRLEQAARALPSRAPSLPPSASSVTRRRCSVLNPLANTAATFVPICPPGSRSSRDVREAVEQGAERDVAQPGGRKPRTQFGGAGHDAVAEQEDEVGQLRPERVRGRQPVRRRSRSTRRRTSPRC